MFELRICLNLRVTGAFNAWRFIHAFPVLTGLGSFEVRSEVKLAFCEGSLLTRHCVSGPTIMQPSLLACKIWFMLRVQNLNFSKYTKRVSSISEALRRCQAKSWPHWFNTELENNNLVFGAKEELPQEQDNSSKNRPKLSAPARCFNEIWDFWVNDGCECQ